MDETSMIKTSVVDAIVSFAVQRLGDFLIQQADSVLAYPQKKADSLQGVRDGVEWLKRELGMMRWCLKDAEEKQDADHRIGEWISDVRDLAYYMEDAIDTYTYNVAVGETLKRKRGLLASVDKIACMFSRKTDLSNLDKEIEALKKRVDDISRRRQVYGIRNIGEAGEGTGGAICRLRELRRSCPYADEEHVVGFEDDTASLVGQLLSGVRRRCVISILGMGGLGKTTLARKLYYHPMVEREFKRRTWVCVSQEYGIRDLLQRIIKSFKRNINKEELEMLEKMSEEDLERHLRQYLQGVRYLVVIDDVWEKETWESLRRAFPDDKNGSRAIVTTRIEEVAERSDERTYVHKLRFLRSDESWELFCRKAFPNNTITRDGTSCCPSDLEALGGKMVKKCGGLPLAIIVLGGLLSRKQPHEWQTVKEHLWRYLRNDSIHISHLLTLSFNDLPNLLKPCFLHLGLFPEDSQIITEKLIRMWVAEGFIPPGIDQTMEEVAEDSLNELIGRSLIQVAKRSWRRTTVCRVHDLLRDLAVKRAMELNFLHIYNGVIHSAPLSSTVPSFRREAVHSGIERYVLLEYSNPRLRSFMVFDSEGELSIELLTLIHTRFRLLRVLDIEMISCRNFGTTALPDEVGELIHLKYLGLRPQGTETQELPPSIVRLQALQTLDVFSQTTRMRLPGDIGNLTQLRHLFGKFVGLEGVDHLTNLQSLKYVDIREWFNIDTVNLINLRYLYITYLDSYGEIEGEFSWDPTANLRNLQSLSVRLPRSMYFSSFQPLSNCKCLHQLMLHGKIGNLPEQIHEYLPNLKFLGFHMSELKQDPMPTLEKLPNLMILQLGNGRWRKLTCKAEGFPRLEVLMLSYLPYLEEFEVAEGAMPMLKGLQIHKCDQFIVPERLRSIPDADNLHWDWNWDFDLANDYYLMLRRDCFEESSDSLQS